MITIKIPEEKLEKLAKEYCDFPTLFLVDLYRYKKTKIFEKIWFELGMSWYFGGLSRLRNQIGKIKCLKKT